MSSAGTTGSYIIPSPCFTFKQGNMTTWEDSNQLLTYLASPERPHPRRNGNERRWENDNLITYINIYPESTPLSSIILQKIKKDDSSFKFWTNWSPAPLCGWCNLHSQVSFVALNSFQLPLCLQGEYKTVFPTHQGWGQPKVLPNPHHLIMIQNKRGMAWHIATTSALRTRTAWVICIQFRGRGKARLWLKIKKVFGLWISIQTKGA